MRDSFYYIFKSLCLTLTAGLFATAAFGQSGKGSISGKVITADGKPASYVSVALKNIRFGANTD